MIFPLFVIPKRFERLTHALEGRCSIQLSYGTYLFTQNGQAPICVCKDSAFIPLHQRFYTFFYYSHRISAKSARNESQVAFVRGSLFITLRAPRGVTGATLRAINLCAHQRSHLVSPLHVTPINRPCLLATHGA